MPEDIRHLHLNYDTSFCERDISYLLATFKPEEAPCAKCKKAYQATLTHLLTKQASLQQDLRVLEKHHARMAAAVAEATEAVEQGAPEDELFMEKQQIHDQLAEQVNNLTAELAGVTQLQTQLNESTRNVTVDRL